MPSSEHFTVKGQSPYKQKNGVFEVEFAITEAKPTGEDTDLYKDFDSYMIRLDPISGYLGGSFGKERSEKLIKEFFFSYA